MVEKKMPGRRVLDMVCGSLMGFLVGGIIGVASSGIFVLLIMEKVKFRGGDTDFVGIIGYSRCLVGLWTLLGIIFGIWSGWRGNQGAQGILRGGVLGLLTSVIFCALFLLFQPRIPPNFWWMPWYIMGVAPWIGAGIWVMLGSLLGAAKWWLTGRKRS